MRNQLISKIKSFSLTTSSSLTASPSVYNLLLLGQSGVGKSTFINALHNYVTYKSIYEIPLESKHDFPVPTAFTMSDDDDNIHKFTIGEEKNLDENENLSLNAGSGTRGCKPYKYIFEDVTINLIDTPGLVDTEGVDKDKKNMENILSFIGQCKFIHGICILLRPDEERLNDVFNFSLPDYQNVGLFTWVVAACHNPNHRNYFLSMTILHGHEEEEVNMELPSLHYRYCIQELLCQLHHTAASNILWIFTKAAGNFYKIGNTHTAIRTMIQEVHRQNPKLNIKFEKSNYFLFDSNSFLYIVARDKIKFSDRDIRSYHESWDHSHKEFHRMMQYVICITPYDVRQSLSIHRVRELIDHLLPHLQQITKNIIEKEVVLQQKEIEVAYCQGDIEELTKILYVDVPELEKKHYDGPRFVCQSSCCRKEVKVDGKTEFSYPQICVALNRSIREYLSEDNVNDLPPNVKMGLAKVLTTIATGLLSEVALPAVVAAIIAKGSYWYLVQKCDECGCINREHTITYDEVHEVVVRKEDPATKEELRKKHDDIDKIKETFIHFLEAELAAIREEMKVVSNANQRFAIFLKRTAIVPYNDAFPNYLRFLIRSAHGEEKAERLKEHLKVYLEQIEFIENSTKISSTSTIDEIIDTKRIDDIVEQLKNLTIYGAGIQTAIQNIHLINDCPAFNEINAYTVHDQFF